MLEGLLSYEPPEEKGKPLPAMYADPGTLAYEQEQAGADLLSIPEGMAIQETSLGVIP